MSERTCRKCNETKPMELFTKHKQCRNGYTHYCKSCDAFATSQLRRDSKLKAVKYKGGACGRCGGVFHPSVYDFHHIDPTQKDADPGTFMGRKWETIKKELDKCVLLCANCHRLTHAEDGWK